MVEEPFHISKACIEPTTSKGGYTSVYVEVDDEEFLACNLSDKIVNENLDLNFNTGDKIVFKTTVGSFELNYFRQFLQAHVEFSGQWGCTLDWVQCSSRRRTL